jgi:hypothetical protein
VGRQTKRLMQDREAVLRCLKVFELNRDFVISALIVVVTALFLVIPALCLVIPALSRDPVLAADV